MKIGIHIFRKDLRLDDNLALLELSKNVDKIILLFILDPYQISDKDNEFHRSHPAIQFMKESLLDLNIISGNKLIILNKYPDKAIKHIINSVKVDYLSFNSDFTKYSIERDNDIKKNCKDNNIIVIENDHDQTLTNMENLVKKDGKCYTIFGAFYKNSLKHKVNKPIKFNEFDKLYKPSTIKSHKLIIENPRELSQKGGRIHCLDILKPSLMKKFENRDNLKESSGISASLNFGCVSVREIYNKYKNNEEFTKQIAWRDYYTSITRYHPDGNKYKFLDDRYNKLNWRKISDKGAKEEWNIFMDCKTGFLMIDASMKELLSTSFMNNKLRLLWCSFVIKYLQFYPFDKSYGAHSLFSRLLIDCSFSQNKLNHDWIISTLDMGGRRFSKKGYNSLSGRVIKIDNSIIKKYQGFNYIRKWLPHLKDLSDKELSKYPTIFDADKRYNDWCDLFKNI